MQIFLFFNRAHSDDAIIRHLHAKDNTSILQNRICGNRKYSSTGTLNQKILISGIGSISFNRQILFNSLQLRTVSFTYVATDALLMIYNRNQKSFIIFFNQNTLFRAFLCTSKTSCAFISFKLINHFLLSPLFTSFRAFSSQDFELPISFSIYESAILNCDSLIGL